MLDRIDHVGIACHDLDAKIAFYRSVFGLSVASREVNEEQGVLEAMLRISGAPGGASWVQLLQPLGPDTPVGKFLARRGEGVHHIGYGVTDINEALDVIGARGVRLLDQRPRHGSMGASIAFLHPRDVGGVLTELVQAPADEPREPGRDPQKPGPGDPRGRSSDPRGRRVAPGTDVKADISRKGRVQDHWKHEAGAIT